MTRILAWGTAALLALMMLASPARRRRMLDGSEVSVPVHSPTVCPNTINLCLEGGEERELGFETDRRCVGQRLSS